MTALLVESDAETAKPNEVNHQVIIQWHDEEIKSKNAKRNLHNHSDQIKIKGNLNKKDNLEEKKVEYQYMHNWGLQKWKKSAVYVKDVYMHTGLTGMPDSETAVGAVTIAGVVLFAVPSLMAYGGHSYYTYYHNQLEENKLNQKKQHNVKVDLFNTKLQELKVLENKLKQKNNELIDQEEKLNNFEFQIEREHYLHSKTILCIGPTGYGKSLVCNRLIGNKKDIDDLEGADNEAFKVADYGDPDSMTADLNKKIKKVTIIDKMKNEQIAFLLTVVDSPGSYDSKGQDKNAQNKMAEYFQASGGVNMFCIFFKFGDKIDATYQDLLDIYNKFWGEQFWKHCVIVITNCDRDNKKLTKCLPKTKKKIKTFLKEKMNVLEDIPIYEFGENNFDISTNKLFSSLIDKNPENAYNDKYKCDNIISPIDKLWDEIKPMYATYKSLVTILEASLNELRISENQIQ